MNVAPRLILLLALCCLRGMPPPCAAQTGSTGEIAGAVTDNTGASIAQAIVTIVSVGTEAVRETHANLDGNFSFLQLPTGTYRVTATAAGFAPLSQEVSLTGAAVSLALHLPPQSSASTVEVNAEAMVLDPTAPARVEIPFEQIERLPSHSVSSPLSSLITNTAPGVAADSNGSFHPLGDHAEASFFIDGQPITDQQSRTFSSQFSLNALQSIEIREGAPQAEVGDKTSMVIVAQTRSGLGQSPLHGGISLGRGAFATSQASAHLAYGTDRFGTFSALDALNSGRFLDTPELVALHANGNAGNFIERLDYKLTPRTSLRWNNSLSHSWFQTPNTYDQQALGQNQRQTIQSFNIAPAVLHTFSDSAFLQTNLWVRQDKIRYRPSADLFSDMPAYLAQSRRLTNAGVRTEYNVVHGRHSVTLGAEWKHTFLAERFSTGLTDATYNSPCLAVDGSPSADTALRSSSQCESAGLFQNPDILPNLVPIDLTRQGTTFNFHGYTDIKQESFFAKDSVRLGNFTANLGLRFEAYNGITASTGLQPRVGIAYTSNPLHTVVRAGYSRVFITPYNENLIVASSAGPGSTASSLGAANASPLDTGHRNQFNVGAESQITKRFTLTAEYFWKFTYGAYDFDVLLNSPLTFPTQFRKSKIDGGLVRVNLNPTHGLSGYVTASHVRSRLFGPEIGGVSFSAPYTDVTRPDHDEAVATNSYLRYQIKRSGPWVGFSWRYDSGLVSVATPTFATVLRLPGDNQAQLGLYCGSVLATVAQPIRSCAAASLGSKRIRIPADGTENDDRNPSRVAPRNVFDLSFGDDDLYRHERQRIGFHLDLINLTNNDGLYNFLSTFSGTHFLTPRSVTAQLRYTF